VLAGEDILSPHATGLVGQALHQALIDWFGAPGTFVLLGALLSVGTLLTFQIRVRRRDAAS
jgi:DNA translocase FtsK/SpoIIIE-like protein